MNYISYYHKRKTIPLPYRYYFIPTLIFTIVGIVNSIYLAVTHYKNYTDLTYRSFCAISRAINCDTVAQSPWSIFAGLPVSYWGIFAYALFFYVLLKARKYQQRVMSLWAMLLLMAGVFAITSICLAYISLLKIDAHCILCILSHCLSFILFIYSLLIYRRFSSKPFFEDLLRSFKLLSKNKTGLISILIIWSLFCSIWIFIPHYWKYQPNDLRMATDLRKGITKEGNPWIGSENAKTIIHVYSDYMCFQCAKMHYLLRSMVSATPTDYQLIIHHYPLDHSFNPIVVNNPYHVGSGKMALLSVYAMTKGKFWEMNDILFEIGRSKLSFDTKSIADKIGFTSGELAWAIEQPDFRKIIDIDIRRGLKHRITSTPSFVIDENVFTGSIPKEFLPGFIAD